MSRIFRLSLFLLAGVALLPAQINIGHITGTVADETGAAVPNAKVTAINGVNGATLQTTSRTNGQYEFPSLAPNTYTLTAEHDGFSLSRITEVVLDSASTRTVNFSLKIGLVTQAVEVRASEQQVDTQSAAVATTVDSRQITEVGLNGRYVTQLMQIIPGMAGTGLSTSYASFGIGTTGLSLNGLAGSTINLTLDGTSNMEVGGGGGKLYVAPTADALQEGRIQSSSYLAESGGHSGAQMDFTIKSGGREVHGNVYEYIRNSITDARSFFAATPPSLHFHNWGATIGGPIPMPKQFNLKDKLFIFVSGERKTVNQSTSTLATVPTAAMIQGNFAGQFILSTPVAVPNQPGTTTPYPNGIVPPSQWSVNGPKLLSVFTTPSPLAPNYPGPGGNFIYDAISLNHTTTAMGKIDYVASDKRRLTYSHSYSTIDVSENLGLGGLGMNRPYPGYSLRLADTEILSPTWLLSTAISAQHDRNNNIILGACREGTNGLGLTFPELFPAVFNGTGRCTTGLAPTMILGGTQAYDNPISRNQGVNEYLQAAQINLNVDVTKVKGSHTFKFGVFYSRHRRNAEYFGFGSTPSGAQALTLDGTVVFSNQNNVNTTGNSIADALLGNSQYYGETQYELNQYVRQNQVEFYVQDTWNATKRLHIDYGVRYAYIPWYYMRDNNYDTFVPSYFDPAQAPRVSATTGLIIPGAGNPYNGLVMYGDSFPPNPSLPYTTNPAVLALFKGLPRGGAPTDRDNWGPRIGISYDPFGDGKTAIRTGFGVFFDRLPSDNVSQQGGAGNVPFNNVVTINLAKIDTPAAGTAAPASPPTITGFTTTLRTPHVMGYNFDIQRQLPGKLILVTGFVGNLQRHLLQAFNINAIPAGTKFANPTVPAAGINALRQYQGYNSLNINSFSSNGYYNSWQTTVRRRVGNGLNMSVSFTWAKGMLQTTPTAANGNSTLPLIYAPSSLFVKFALTMNAQYQLPALSGKNVLLRGALGGWSLGMVLLANSGKLATLVCNGDPGGVYATTTLCPLSGDPNENAPHTVQKWFNTSVVQPVSVIPNGQFSGQDPGGVVRLPGFWNWDQSISKDFKLSEAKVFQLRVEAFNVPNHPSWTGVSTSQGATFGQVNGASAGRVFQGALKFRF